MIFTGRFRTFSEEKIHFNTITCSIELHPLSYFRFLGSLEINLLILLFESVHSRFQAIRSAFIQPTKSFVCATKSFCACFVLCIRLLYLLSGIHDGEGRKKWTKCSFKLNLSGRTTPLKAVIYVFLADLFWHLRSICSDVFKKKIF